MEETITVDTFDVLYYVSILVLCVVLYLYDANPGLYSANYMRVIYGVLAVIVLGSIIHRRNRYVQARSED